MSASSSSQSKRRVRSAAAAAGVLEGHRICHVGGDAVEGAAQHEPPVEEPLEPSLERQRPAREPAHGRGLVGHEVRQLRLVEAQHQAPVACALVLPRRRAGPRSPGPSARSVHADPSTSITSGGSRSVAGAVGQEGPRPSSAAGRSCSKNRADLNRRLLAVDPGTHVHAHGQPRYRARRRHAGGVEPGGGRPCARPARSSLRHTNAEPRPVLAHGGHLDVDQPGGEHHFAQQVLGDVAVVARGAARPQQPQRIVADRARRRRRARPRRARPPAGRRRSRRSAPRPRAPDRAPSGRSGTVQPGARPRAPPCRRGGRRACGRAASPSTRPGRRQAGAGRAAGGAGSHGRRRRARAVLPSQKPSDR